MEVERKFLVDKWSSVNGLITELQESAIYTSDWYFDTEDDLLYHSGKSFRIRQVEGEGSVLCIKTPTPNLYEREEHEMKEADWPSAEPIILRLLPEIDDLDKLTSEIYIYNHRMPCTVKDGDTVFELAFDQVVYRMEKSPFWVEELQLEIELKSDYAEREKLDVLADWVMSKINLVPITESKYARGKRLLGGLPG